MNGKLVIENDVTCFVLVASLLKMLKRKEEDCN